MKKESWRKRIQILTVISLLLVLALGYRLFQKQILEHGNYLVLADQQYMIKEDVPANRGKIYFSDMYPAATNNRLYQVLVTPIQVQDKQDAADKLAGILGLSSSDIFNDINNDKYYIPPLKNHLSEADGQKIADLKLQGVLVAPESVRVYPEGQLASQVLGFVDASGDGHYGIEGYYNDQLKGIGGEIYGQKDTQGQIFDVNSQINARNGSDYVLTLDHEIQFKAEEILQDAVTKYQADSGSLIVMDPKTGAVLAMANAPTYDPNNFNKVPTDQQQVFNDAAVSDTWEPGSVFKPLIMAAAINDGKVTPDTENVFGESVTVNGYKIETALKKAYGKENMAQVLQNSDNVAMVWVANLLGKDTMYKYLQDFGFGNKSGIELDNEAAGKLDNVKTWSDAELATISFGQGITATPLQVLAATSAIANQGKLMQSYIVDKTIDYSGKEDVTQPKVVGQVITADTAQKVTDMMVSVVESSEGNKAAVPGYKIAGKTGTAQVAQPGGGYYTDRHVGSFVGFAPADDPKFAILVKLDNPKNVDWAESSAAPTFSEMAAWLFNYYGIAPTQ
jgi:cell division protein FtsI/penicillin-binding protein 2